ncbi:MAG: DUF6010 family protein [Alcaligenes nematophilus]|uniref:DUF6010 family protein n=1 Tax=Alcaligenes nematophilus TaxID=2994643 RepID=UPI003D067EBC
MPSSFFADATIPHLVLPVLVALVLIALISLLAEPARQKFSAIFLAGAGAAYLSGGFGLWEFAFCAVMTVLAYLGLSHYRAIAIGWLAHSAWDYLHHLYGNPIIPFEPMSSFGCTLCDPMLAAWYALGAPSIWKRFNRPAKRSLDANA